MSFGRMTFTINGLRTLAIAGLGADIGAHYAKVKPETADFLAGMSVGILLVLTIGLFYAPRATVERMPFEDDLPAEHPLAKKKY